MKQLAVALQLLLVMAVVPHSFCAAQSFEVSLAWCGCLKALQHLPPGIDLSSVAVCTMHASIYGVHLRWSNCR
jgi:hypothetical protein